MKKYLIVRLIGVSLMSIQISEGQKMEPLVELTAQVLNEQQKPIKGVAVQGSGLRVFAPFEESKQDGITDENGKVVLRFRSLGHASIYAVKKGDYYVSSSHRGRDEKLKFSPFIYRKDIPESQQSNPPMKKEVTLKGSIVLRKVIDPTPLYVKRVAMDFPAKRVWLGYDLEEGDWVPPHGHGKRADIRLRSNPQKQDPTSDQLLGAATLEIDFGQHGGYIQVTKKNGYLPMSSLKMPHKAFSDGYKISPLKLEYEKSHRESFNAESGYFFRTRVKKEGDEIISANYGKINSDIVYIPVEKDPVRVVEGREIQNSSINGRVEFNYYFNPVPNNRSLEFDLKKNLFSTLKKRSSDYIDEHCDTLLVSFIIKVLSEPGERLRA